MKALILAGGRGTRLRPLTHTKNKHLIPIANEPIIYWVIKDVIDSGISDIIVNINKGDTSVKEYVESKKFRATFKFIEQPEPNGMMYPIVLAEKHIGKEPFVLHGGDNILPKGIKEHIEYFENEKPDSLILGCRVPNWHLFGVLQTKRGNKLRKTIEKPKKYITDLVATAIYFYNSSVFKAMKKVKPIDPKGKGVFEYYPPPVHQWLVDNKYDVRVNEVTGWWKDIGDPSDMLLANRLVLEHKKEFDGNGRIDKKTSVNGPLDVGKRSSIKNSQIRGPITIGENTKIINSYIGPFTSIGDNCRIENAKIENSIVMGDAEIFDVERRLDSCLIGWYARITENTSIDDATSLFIGDDSVVKL
jgi:glucose-1-phosphate thymidylyltransferase